MRLLVGLNHLELGGCQLNALDFATAARDHGHEIVMFAASSDGDAPLAAMVRKAGLPLELIGQPRVDRKFMPFRPGVARKIGRLAAREHTDLIHAYEPSLIMDSFYGPHLSRGVPLVGTIYGNFVPWWMPRYLPLIAGAREIADRAAPSRTRPPAVIEPPVNTDIDSPGLADGDGFRREHGLGADIVLSIVCRLEPSMKAPGIRLAINAMQILDDPAIRLVITGDGPSAAELTARAERANALLGRRAVIMTGPLDDPRPVYAATDIALGMGGSALRAMAFGKPLIVLGTEGFAKPVRPDTAPEFLAGGFLGTGSGDTDPRPLAGFISELADQPGRRAELGALGRQLIMDRFSLKAASASLEEVYAGALAGRTPRSQRLREAARAAACKTGSDGLPGSIKDRLRPIARPFRLAER